MFKLYDRVTSKKTGLPSVGTIKGICDGEFFLTIFGPNVDAVWSRIYPDWKTKLCYYVEFDEPQKTYSLQEARQQLNDYGIFDTEEIESRYQNAPVTKFSAYPYDDLELL